MNWIKRLSEIKGCDLYSQNCEGLILEYIFSQIRIDRKYFVDIGGGDGFYLSNTRHLSNLGWPGVVLDRENGDNVTVENVFHLMLNKWGSFSMFVGDYEPELISIDIDGNDYWILRTILTKKKPAVIVAEFNAMYTDSRTIAYNPDHVWAGDSYYGFTFEAGKKLAEKHGYKVIFQTGDMNMFMIRADLIEGLSIPPVTYKQNDFFKLSTRTDWVTV